MEKYPVLLLNTKIPLLFRFSQNPNSISYSVKKVYQEVRTIGGYVFEHWGKTPTTLKVDGLIVKNTGFNSMIGIKNETSEFKDTLMSAELLMLRQMFELDRKKIASIFSVLQSKKSTIKNSSSFFNSLSDTLFYYKSTIYSGFFTDFDWSESGDSPYYNKYSFTFLATGSTEDFLMDYILKGSLGGVPLATLRVAGIVAGAANLGLTTPQIINKFKK